MAHGLFIDSCLCLPCGFRPDSHASTTTTTHATHDTTMAQPDGKENIADGLIANTSFKAPALSPKKSSRKTRSKSIGPGGLGELEAPALKESSGNRRKVGALDVALFLCVADESSLPSFLPSSRFCPQTTTTRRSGAKRVANRWVCSSA